MTGGYPVTKKYLPDNDGNDKGGSLRARAKRAGMTIEKFAQSNIHSDSEVGKLARLFYTLQGTHGRGQSNMSGAGDAGRSPTSKLYQIG